MDQIEEIKKKTDIVALISEVTELKRAGKNFKGLCPFHSEKTPSFIVTPELQIYKCFGCGVGGDAFKFLMEYEKIDFPQALKILADRAGVKLKPLKGFASHTEKEEIYNLNFLASEFYHYLLTRHKIGEKALNYLRQRGISEDSITTFKLGYSPDKQDAVSSFLIEKRGNKPQLLEKAGLVVKTQRGLVDRFRGRVIFPLKDHFGNTLGFAGRVLETKGDLAKYINSPETLVYKKSQVLFGLDLTKQEIKKQGFAVVVEGELDCISSWQAGIKNVVAIKGSALTEDQSSLIHRFTQKIVLTLDADFAGDQAARRGLDILQKQGLTVQIASLGNFKDPDEMAQKDPEGLKKVISQAEGMYDFLIGLSFKKYGTETTEAKSQVSRELSPVLASIEDEIVRAHCVKQVAAKLNVPEEAVLAQIRKISVLPAQTVSQDKENSDPKTRRDILEEQLLAILFQKNPKEALSEHVLKLISSGLRVRLLGELGRFFKTKEQFVAVEFLEILPSELKDSFERLLLIEIKDEQSTEVEKLTRELEVLDLKEQMQKVVTQIQEKEEGGKLQELVRLEEQLTRLGQELSNLEA